MAILAFNSEAVNEILNAAAGRHDSLVERTGQIFVNVRECSRSFTAIGERDADHSTPATNTRLRHELF